MREQDVYRDIGAGIELDGGIIASVMGNLGDPAIMLSVVMQEGWNGPRSARF